MPPDYSKAGDDGGEKPDSVVRTIQGTSNLPTPLACRSAYGLEVRVEQAVRNCRTDYFSYEAMFSRAFGLGMNRILALKCHEDCPLMDDILVSRGWTCRNRKAYAAVRWLITCRPFGPAGRRRPGLPLPTADDFKGSELEDLPGVEFAAEETIVESYEWPLIWASMHILNCPASQTLLYTYHQPIHKCPPADFKPFVDAAMKAVEAYSNTYVCLSPCISRVSVNRTEWLCVKREVRVNVYYELRCVRLRRMS